MWWNILLDWTVTQVFHNGTNKISSGGIPAEVSCPHLERAYRCTQTHHEGVRGKGGVERKGERKDPSNVVFYIAFTIQHNPKHMKGQILNHSWSRLKVFGCMITDINCKLHLRTKKKIRFTIWFLWGRNRKSCTVEDFQNKGVKWMTVFLNVIDVNQKTRDSQTLYNKIKECVWHIAGWPDVQLRCIKCTKWDNSVKVKTSRRHTYLSLLDDPLDSIWHHMRVEFQAATQYSETWEVASTVFNTAPTKSRRRQWKKWGLLSCRVDSTHLRCRSMLAALSNMAVGLAIFLPTACAKGWRAPWKRGETEAS